MSSSISGGGIGNILRLQGLKSVAGRNKKRVLPGAEFLDEMNDEMPEVEGTSSELPNFANFIPKENKPEADVGTELTPQSYDVRANTVEAPEEDNPQNWEYAEAPWTVLGRNLKKLYDKPFLPENKGYRPSREESVQPIQRSAPATPQAPPIETMQVDEQEGLPPVTSSEEEWNNWEKESEDNAMRLVQEQAQEEALIDQEKEIENEEAEEPKEAGTYVEKGSSQNLFDASEENPELKSEIERIFNTSLTPEREKEVNMFEEATQAYIDRLNGVETALSNRSRQLLEKIQNRDLTTSEKISMAMALIAPAVVAGLVGGKEAAIGALSTSGQAIAGLVGEREKSIKEAEKLLPEVEFERSNISKQILGAKEHKAELVKKINKEVPNAALRDLFMRDGKVQNGKLVLDTGNPLLPLKSTAVRTEKDYDNFREKKMPELTQKITATEKAIDILGSIEALVDYSEQSNKGIARDYIPLYDVTAKTLKAFIPASRDTFIDEDGNEVKVSELYNTLLEQSSDAYGQASAVGGKPKAFKEYREHYKEMLPNPYSWSSLIQGKTKLGTIKAQIKSIKDNLENGTIQVLDSAGVDTEPVKKTFSKLPINNKKNENTRKKNRAEEAAKQVIGE